MTARLEDMVLVVTGAASGIGRSIAELAVARGVRGFCLSDIDADGLSETAEKLKCDAHVETVVADLKEPVASANIADRAIARFGRIDGLVNAAGVTTRASFVDGTTGVWDDVFAINARSTFLLMQQAIMNMLERKAAGAIVNIQSMNAHCGHPDLAIYAASKGAIQTLTKNAANAHLGDGIRVNGINLGWTLTDAEDRLQSEVLKQGDDWAARAGASLPLGRLLSPTEASRLAVYLLDPISAPLTGASIDMEQWIAGAPP